MAKHTPGPWTIGVSDDNQIHCVDGSDSTGGIIEICEVWGTLSDKEETEESRANARLIAASPEMLEALKVTTSSLVAAISLLKRGSKKAAPSNTMFDMMVSDYEMAVELGRTAIINAEGEELK